MIIVAGSILLISIAVFLFSKLDNSTDILTELKGTFRVWFFFWLGLILEIGFEYFWKKSHGNTPVEWLPDNFWLLIQLILAFIICIRVYIKLPKQKNLIFKVFLISIQVLVNFIFYLLAQQYYISGSSFFESM